MINVEKKRMLTIALLRQNILMDLKSNPNPMKKVNPEDLVVGQEYYVKMKLSDKDSTDLPYCFEDIQGSIEWLPQDQPIYTAEPDNDRLKMVVGVASRLYASTNFGNYDTCAAKPSNSSPPVKMN